MRDRHSDFFDMSDSLVHAIAGATGGVVSMALTYPLITVSTRSQVNSKEQKLSQLETLKQILREEGVAGLFRLLITYKWCSFGLVWYICNFGNLLLLVRVGKIQIPS